MSEGIPDSSLQQFNGFQNSVWKSEDSDNDSGHNSMERRRSISIQTDQDVPDSSETDANKSDTEAAVNSEPFTTMVRKKSVVIVVDRWSTDTVKVSEIDFKSQGSRGGNPSDTPYAEIREVKYGSVDKKTSERSVAEGIALRKGGVLSANSNDDYPYAVVDKRKSASPKQGKHNAPVQLEGNTDACYGEVRKATRPAISDKSATENCYDELDGFIEDPLPRKHETLYAYIGGKVMVVSDDGDYASVKSLSDSDISKDTDLTLASARSMETLQVPERNLTRPRSTTDVSDGSKSKKTTTPNHKYAVRYLGSAMLTEDALRPHRCSSSVSDCIVHISQQSNSSLQYQIVHEWPMDMKMVMDISDSEHNLKLLDSRSAAVYSEHFLHSIRFWAVGKEANSKHFAYVTRNKSNHQVCRVFSCDIAARHVTSTIRIICHSLAAAPHKEANRKSPDGSLSGGNSTSDSIKNGGASTKKNATAGNADANRRPDEPALFATCNYVGVVSISKPPGKETVTNAVQELLAKKEKYVKVDLQLSTNTLVITKAGESEKVLASFDLKSVIYVGSSSKNKKFVAILVRNDETVYGHVFQSDSAKTLVTQLQTAGQVDAKPVDKKQKTAASIQTNPTSKGVRGFFSKAKK